jgi:hypothetical protein
MNAEDPNNLTPRTRRNREITIITREIARITDEITISKARIKDYVEVYKLRRKRGKYSAAGWLDLIVKEIRELNQMKILLGQTTKAYEAKEDAVEQILNNRERAYTMRQLSQIPKEVIDAEILETFLGFSKFHVTGRLRGTLGGGGGTRKKR